MHIYPLAELPALILAFLGAAFITWYSMPRVVKVASIRKLTDKPGAHKIHLQETPALGGVGIFSGFAFGFLLSVNGYMQGVSYFTAALMILFFIGLKDDLISITPYKKIIVQLAALLIVTYFTGLRFTSFHGFMGINGIPLWVSFVTTIFLGIIFINAFNLIDGIDGLAASIGIIASTAFGTWSFLAGDSGYAIMSAALTGSLIVFLFYNMSNGRNKIFMGDTGSLAIGFILTIMAIRFNEINAGNAPVHDLVSSPSVAIAILIVPLFDTLRVIIIRLMRGESPLAADNRHIHHLLLRAGYSHRRATLMIALSNILVVAVAFLLDHIGILKLGLVLLFLSCLLTLPVYLMVARKEGWYRKREAAPAGLKGLEFILDIGKIDDRESVKDKEAV